MALNKRRLARSQQSTRGGGGDFMRLKDGKNTVRIFSFPHTVTKNDFTRGIYKEKDEIEVGDKFDEIEREVPRHFTEDGVVNCPGANCRWCVEAAELLASPDKADQKAGKKLQASRHFYVNAVDVDNVEAGMQIGQFPSSVFNAILTYITDPEYGESILGCKGRDFIIDRDSNESPQNMYKTRIRDKERCEELDEDLQSQVRDMFTMKVLEPGWSSEESLNSMGDEKDPEESDIKEKDERSSTGAKDDDDRPGDLKDQKPGKPAKDGDTPPWDKSRKHAVESSPSFKVEDIVTFVDDGETLTGEIKEINGDMSVIKAGKHLYDIPLNELKPKSRSGRRA